MKRKLVTRIISVAVASCMMAGMLTGCGSTGDSTGAGESTSGGGVKQPLRKEREQMRQRTQRRQKVQIQEARTLPGNL